MQKLKIKLYNKLIILKIYIPKKKLTNIKIYPNKIE